ncbi:hypothetical protein POKO110462_11350 [Pontibacter korlensis]|uniref:hypothetical protein n=1 Tax=Pontibacter korlensis TaxID=400092 RepID=UPI000695D0DA|nr:hypothetical protein [Pontibacter korlensis]
MKSVHPYCFSGVGPLGETLKLFKSEKLVVEYVAEEKTLIVGWKGKVKSEELRNGYDELLELVHRLRPRKWQLDLTKRDKLKKKDQRWIFENFLPKVLRAVNDDVFMAVIVPVIMLNELVSELSGDELMHKGNFLIMQNFMYREEGQRWLNEMEMIKLGANKVS